MTERAIMKGNEALAEAALRAGCRFFAGYPITPQTEVLEYLSWRMPEIGGQFVQTEDELTGLHMLMGSALAGGRVLSTSSGPGWALFHEGLSYLCACDIPAVLVDVQRLGGGCGGIGASQGDYEEVVHGGGNGDSQYIVLTPASVQEEVDLVQEAYEIAEKYRNPVVIMTDAIIGQMMEGVELPSIREVDIERFDWTFKPFEEGGTGKKHAGWPATGYDQYGPYLLNKWAEMKENEQRWESVQVQDADVVCVAYGISSRVCKEAVKKARAKGVKLGLIRLITAWPFPVKAFGEVKEGAKLLAVEMSLKGQMAADLQFNTKFKYPTYAYTSVDVVPDVDKVLENVDEIIAGTAKEV